jgi:hypothetical protein
MLEPAIGTSALVIGPENRIPQSQRATTEMSDRRRERQWSVDWASEFLLGHERKYGAGVRLHRFVKGVGHTGS